MEKKEELSQELVDFLKFYVEPHDKVSRDVVETDIQQVIEDAHVLYNLCFTQNGPASGAYAVAHPQVNDTDPLRFFVTQKQEIIINPVIVDHTRHTVDSIEGCTTFAHYSPVVVQRWNKCVVEFQTLVKGEKEGEFKLSDKITVKLSGKDAKVWQHETDHLNSKYVY